MKIKRILFVVMPLLLFLALVLFPWKQMNGNAVAEGSEDTSELEISETETSQAAPPSKEEPTEESVKSLIGSMTPEQKVAQMFFITPEALTGYSRVTAAGDATKKAFDEYPVGGLIYFSANLVTPEQTKRMLSGVSDYALKTRDMPVFLGVDEEGGRVARIGGNSAFAVEKVKAMGVLSQSGNSDAIYKAAGTIGSYLSELGFNVDFAPDADVITNPDNKVIGDRSFGTDPQAVAGMAWAFRNGLHDSGILASYKHFPGHGGTLEDSHSGYAYSYKSLDELKKAELVPFQSGCDKGVDFILASHISTPAVTGDDTPASLSRTWITDILRNEMGYKGIIITDSLSMEAVSSNYTSGEAAVLAVKAGNDMLMMPQDFKSAYAALLKAVNDGDIPESRIDESVSRILKAKLALKRL